MTKSIQQAAERLTRSVGTLVSVYEYRNQDGSLSYCNLRIMQANGRKTFRMLSDAGSGFELRRDESLKPEGGWPLYGLASLATSGPVFVVEGEKDVDSLHVLGLAAVTSGSTSTDVNADWGPLRGRAVVLWPDNDDAGKAYMDRVQLALGAIGCSVERIDTTTLELPEKGDCADWLELHPSAVADEVMAIKRVKETSTRVLCDLPVAEIVRGDMLHPMPVDWLWNGWLAAGKLHILGGQAGTGKTTIAMSLAATVTTGGLWPDGTQAACGDVVIWSAEDDPADTLAPRLMAAGADMSRVHFITGKRDGDVLYPFDPASDTGSLIRSLGNIEKPRMIVIDPIVGAVAGDSHKNAEVRRGLQPLVDLAQSHRCALLGITHFSKGTGGREPIERITGSLAFGALARVVMVTAKREEGDDNNAARFLARAKSNIGPDGGGFAYDLVQGELADHPGIVASSVQWGAALEGAARELLAEAENRDDGEGGDAVSFLRELLADGPVPTGDVKRQASDSGYAWRTIQRAMRRAGVESQRGGFGLPATWRLASRATVAPVAPHNLNGANGATGYPQPDQDTHEGSEGSTQIYPLPSLPSTLPSVEAGIQEALPPSPATPLQVEPRGDTGGFQAVYEVARSRPSFPIELARGSTVYEGNWDKAVAYQKRLLEASVRGEAGWKTDHHDREEIVRRLAKLGVVARVVPVHAPAAA